jgi:mono/diheme cytochrome c family protein
MRTIWRELVVSLTMRRPISTEVTRVSKRLFIGAHAVFLSTFAISAAADSDNDAIERGRYVVSISGCNDCHTPAYGERSGDVPEADWLIGVPIGFQGPWGTSYPGNLRKIVANMDEAQFIARARSQLLPPMPWYNLRDMSDDDIAAMYSFIRSLGSAGQDMPAYVPPGQKVNTPYFDFVPRVDE